MQEVKESPKVYEQTLPLLDLNCDMAQGWGVYRANEEEALLPFVSSVNIACGGHAGDPNLINKAVRIAKQRGLSIGAHISYPDLAGFGRRQLAMAPDELCASILSQIGLLHGIVSNHGMSLNYVRPHGALYWKCSADYAFAETLARWVASFSPWLTLVLPAHLNLAGITESTGLIIAGEIQPDKIYRKDFSPKSAQTLSISSGEFAIAQVKSLVYRGKLIVEGGKQQRIAFRTIHLNAERSYMVSLAEMSYKILNASQRLNGLGQISRTLDLQIKDMITIPSLTERWLG